ncbi:MAG: hypothetical protein AB9834_00425 [Lentimicrobium sp.]
MKTMNLTNSQKKRPSFPRLGEGAGGWGLLIIISYGLISCHTGKQSTALSTKTTITERQTDTVLHSLPDSAILTALLKCDSLGNAYLEEIIQLKTGRATRPEVRVKDNFIYLKCRVDSMAVYVSMHRQFKATSDTTSTVVTVFKERQKGKLETFLDRAIILLVGSILGALILFIWFRN